MDPQFDSARSIVKGIQEKIDADDAALATEQSAVASEFPYLYFVSIPKEMRLFKYQSTLDDLRCSERVLVQTPWGLRSGTITSGCMTRTPEDKLQYPKISRRMMPRDEDYELRTQQREAEAMQIVAEKIRDSGLDLKLLRIDVIQKENKIIITYGAEQRIDFRSLVKELATLLRARIQMRQVGVRDESRIVGSLGSCGLECCCSSYLHQFAPISIKMAKDQHLALNPLKLSGICGRLKCCLVYEHAVYIDAAKTFPSPGNKVSYLGKECEVASVNILKPFVILRTMETGETIVVEADFDKILRKGGPRHAEPKSSSALAGLEDDQAQADPTPLPEVSGAPEDGQGD